MSHEQYYEDAYNYCIENRGGHLLHALTPLNKNEVWQNYAVHYCSRCMCHFIERIIDDIHYGVWINPDNMKILKIQITPLEFNNEENRYKARLL